MSKSPLDFRPLSQHDFRATIIQEPEGVSQKRSASRALADVLHGKSPLVVLKGFFTKSVCEAVNDNVGRVFVDQRYDGLAIPEYGPTHYDTPLNAYFGDVEKMRNRLASLFEGLYPNPLEALHEYIAGSISSRVAKTYRLAEHEGRKAGDFRVRIMNDPLGYGTGNRTEVNHWRLPPHEDFSQLLDERQKGFEVQEIVAQGGNVCGVNVCLSDGGYGNPANDLHVWNRGRNPVEVEGAHPGFPYPDSAVRYVQHLSVVPGTGDVLLLNSKFLHAVGMWPNRPKSQFSDANRTTLSWFMGKKDKDTVVRWT